MTNPPAGWKQNTESVRRLTQRLRAAPVEDWNRLGEATASIRGDSIDALWQRARHRSLWLPWLWRRPVIGGLLFAFSELKREFDHRPQRQAVADARAAEPSRFDPEHQSALIDLWELAVERLPEDRTTVEVILIAASLASNPSADEAMLAEAWRPLASVVLLQEIREPP